MISHRARPRNFTRQLLRVFNNAQENETLRQKSANGQFGDLLEALKQGILEGALLNHSETWAF